MEEVEQVFLQTEVNVDDRGALRFLLHKEPPLADKLTPVVDIWRMTRVTFRATSSPLLLAATIHQYSNVIKSVLPKQRKS